MQSYSNSTLMEQQTSVQNFISFIKNISLHFQNIFSPSQTDLKNITTKTIKLVGQFEKFVSQYNHKILKQIQNSKITVPLIFYRSIQDKIKDPQFMLYRYRGYELKYIFIRINLQCHVHIQIIKNTNGKKRSSIALQKLENLFIYMLYKKLTQSKIPINISMKFLQQNAINYLQQVYQIMNGQVLCNRCKKSMSYHNQLKCLLPPTIRLQNYNQRRDIENQYVTTVKYLHQNCI